MAFLVSSISTTALYAPSPRARRDAARDLGRVARRALARRGAWWPADSPGALNAWLLLVTTKPPSWRDPLVRWVERPPTAGEPHEGFFYPDPLGFWTEVRRWATLIVERAEPGAGTTLALSVTSVLHLGAQPERLEKARELARPAVVVYLDAPAWEAAPVAIDRPRTHRIGDPHRAGQTYEGFWGRDPEGTAVGKAPQHPAAHNLYRSDEMDSFLRSAPLPPR